ncbi:hypothetical protein A2914_00135 [Candidatus Nomurabacteria bacterium RIFCSPLOWO2_01_FULL_41_21]|uniref:AI-2E family transporter n=2 Tax=Candidatus Nomuraibacteriota TaxID=1752729 RepID=A0A1F6V171_9BACT|nr:MAG: hypothetical protein A2733_01805 [Candidatus Nomurabacteria bacterium RIFCSPHIGHO2_01_FULL_40_20]OGI88699.1 MAG: hypothetical protein A2914_00135 [Candidatus Nomurabacteria bacterium RIFCSPLOWO2_01_FULL_41_21]
MNEGNNFKFVSLSTGTLIRAVLVLIVVAVLWVLRDLALILLTSIVIASFMESAVPFFRKFKIDRVFGVVIAYIFFFLIFLGIFYAFAPLLLTEVYNLSVLLSKYVPDVGILNYFKSEEFSGAKDIVASFSGNSISLGNLLATSKAFVQNLSTGFLQTLSIAFGSIFNVVLIFIISFYLSIQEKGIENFLRIIIPNKYEDYAVDLWHRSQKKIALWVRGQLLAGLLVAVLIYLALSLVGIEYALLLSIIAGIMTLVPYGMLIAVIPAISFAFISEGITSALIVAAIYTIVSQFESFLFTPLIINKVVGLSPLVVILAVLIGYQLGGFWGLVLSVPVAVFFMELLGDLEKRKIFIKEHPEQRNG